jgi:signal transduction histidine kinase/ActR/RegA family two-component response regulator
MGFSSRSPLLRYGAALLACLLVGGLRWALWPVLQTDHPFLFSLLPVIVGAWSGGLGPGLLSTAVCTLGTAYFLLEPQSSLAVTATSDRVALALFLLTGAVLSALGENLGQQRRRLERLTAQAEENVAELVRAEEALREAHHHKDEFLATLAHELRNPLGALNNSLHILNTSGLSGAAERACLTLERQLRQLVRLVDDLLDITRINRGKIELQREKVLLTQVVETAAETSRPVLEAAGHRFEVRLPDQTVWLDGDLPRLAQVLSNLLNNAARYTPAGGQVALEAAPEGGTVRVTIRDNGAGIPPELLPHVFEMFVQGENSGRGGLGIGLALVRSLVQLHGGQVTVHSAGPGRGSEFSVFLPIASAPVPGEPAASPRGPTRLPSRGLRVLVVEDEKDLAESVSILLRAAGNEVQLAADGKSALLAAGSFRPDVVLLDLGLPDTDGLSLAGRLRNGNVNFRGVLIAFSGQDDEDTQERARAAGFQAFLCKPVTPDRLLKQIGEFRNGPAQPGTAANP